MIHSADRSGYFGASDTKYVMRDNHTTESWNSWWGVKCGRKPNQFTGNVYTRAGTVWEHPILEAVDDGITTDGQIIIEDLRIRVNYDGYKGGTIYEVKTHNAAKDFEVKKEYWQQCQVEMYVYKTMSDKWFLPEFKKLYIVSYPLDGDDYYTEEPVVNPSKINMELIEYDEKFVTKYLKKVKKLAKKLEKELE